VDKPVKLTIPSQSSAVRSVQDRILLEMERGGFDHHSLFAVKLGVEEGLMNAIKHGNDSDPTKHVHVEYLVTSKQAEISIEDEGPGFKRKEVPDPTLEENIEKCSGRGILLIEAYMDSVRWSRGGRRVRMVKKNEQTKKTVS
jgi:serine/threonine-protein kinase RsbW